MVKVDTILYHEIMCPVDSGSRLVVVVVVVVLKKKMSKKKVLFLCW